MAIGILDNWFGNKGSGTALDELNIRNAQRSARTAAAALYEKAQEETNKAEYVSQLKAQYMQQMVQTNTNLYNGLAQGISGITTASTDQYLGLGQYTITNVPVTTTGTTTIPGYYTVPNYMPGTVYQSTGAHPGWSMSPTPAVTPQNPQIGDKLVMEWDGKDWITRYEQAFGTPQKKIPPMKPVDFSLDEIEEASELINRLSKKQVEREAA